jgi:hypothetical protein
MVSESKNQNKAVTVPDEFGPDGARSGPTAGVPCQTATGNRDNKEIRPMSGPKSERAPDITVEADRMDAQNQQLF